MSTFEDKKFVRLVRPTARLEFQVGSCGIGDSYMILVDNKIIARSYDPETAWYKAKQYVLYS